MNPELEAYFAAARRAPAIPHDLAAPQSEQDRFAARFLEVAVDILKPILDATSETLLKHGYGATVEIVREQKGSAPNTFPYIMLYFSPEPSSPVDLSYIYTVTGASIGFICRRSDLNVEVVVSHPATRSVERRVNFSTLPLADLTSERVTRLTTDAVMQIIRR